MDVLLHDNAFAPPRHERCPVLSDLVTAIDDRSARGIASAIGRLVSSGSLPVDARLPTVRELSRALGVSPTTVSEAWQTLAAIGAMLQLGHSFEALVRAAEQLCSVPGRIEQFYQAERQVMAVVDYAHTPDALEQTLIAVRNHCQGQLWVVFGCGGDRDKGKRPLLGAIAERLADQLIITADKPRTEDVMAICLDIAAGCTEQQYQLIADRKTAIRTALEQAKAGDLVLIAGKGHEDYQIIGHEVLPYDERAFVRQLVTETAL